MNKVTAFLCDAFATVLIITACGTWFSYCMLDSLPRGEIQDLQYISIGELVLAAFLYLLGRGFQKRNYDFVESKDEDEPGDDE